MARGSPRGRRFHRSVLAFILLPLLVRLAAQSVPDYEQPPLHYSTATPRDAVAALQRRLQAGELSFTGHDRAVLEAVLQALQVPAASQIVVFSKTSLQRGRIRPSHPRALYFSDSIYVGWVPGGLIEIAAIDPVLGPIFYSFDPEEAHRGASALARDPDCLRCHGGTFVRDIPGLLARSVFPADNGEPLLRHGSELVDDSTAFADRWGGWYVTGYHGTTSHRGNTLARETDDRLEFTPSSERPVDLSAFFRTEDYLEPTSDVVALLVFEHQVGMHNSLTSAGQRCRRMMEYQRSLQKAFKEPFTDEPTYDSVKSVFASATEDVLDHLLFRGAAALPAGLEGSRAFQKAFAASATRSQAGLSLKDLSLQGRLFTHRCSFLIYDASFRELPEPLKRRVLAGLESILRAPTSPARYAYLGDEERARILQILTDTHPDAATWKR